MRKHIANIITSFRILFSFILLFLPLFSIWFYAIYLLCGFSDMIDGAVARKTKSVRTFGTTFDSVADFVFVAISFIKIAVIYRVTASLFGLPFLLTQKNYRNTHVLR